MLKIFLLNLQSQEDTMRIQQCFSLYRGNEMPKADESTAAQVADGDVASLTSKTAS